jgi:hypothetical protein
MKLILSLFINTLQHHRVPTCNLFNVHVTPIETGLRDPVRRKIENITLKVKRENSL